MTSTIAMRSICLLLLLISFLAISPAFAQRKAKVDTVAASKAFDDGMSKQKAAKYDSAITFYHQAADGYKAYALSLTNKKKWVASKKRAWEQHFSAQAGISSCLNSKGMYEDALKLLLNTMTCCSAVLGDSNLAMASVANNIGSVIYSQGNYTKALEYFQQALAIRKQALGEQHPEVASSYSNIGEVHRYLGQYSQALEYFQQSLAIKKQVLGEHHSDVASILFNIGNVYLNQGLYDYTLQYYHQSMAIYMQALGEHHPLLSSLYHNIGIVYINQGQYLQALEYSQLSLMIDKHTLGNQHPRVANSYLSIGNIYYSQGQYIKAMDYFKQSLAIKMQALGEHHPEVASSYHNIGMVYRAQGQYTHALENYQLSLDIRQLNQGKQHSEVASSYNSIGRVYKDLRQYALALDYYQRSLAIWKQSLGEQHPKVATSYINIGIVYMAQGQHSKAMEYHLRSLAILKQALGDKYHPELAMCYNNIGKLYVDQIQYSQSLEYYQQSLYAYLPHFKSKHYASLFAYSPDVLKQPLTNLPEALKLRHLPGDDTFALATIRFADRLIDSLRKAYTHEIDKLKLGEYANWLYQVGVEVAQWNKVDEEAFYYSEKNKAAILAQSLNEATALKLGGITDSLLEKDKELRTLVAFYTKASFEEELQCPICDSIKLQNLRNGLFTYQQQLIALKARLESEFPQYFALKYKDSKISVKELQQGFLSENPNSAILEYLLGDTVLYAFCITKDKYAVHRQKLDTTCFKKTNALQLEIKKLGRALAGARLDLDPTTVVSNPSSTLYDYLIKPFEQQTQGKDLIIIPDGELNKIPFEMLMEPHPNLKNISKWQDLPYLIKQHNISYHYSVRLLLDDWQKNKTQPVKSSGFVAFAPVFNDSATGMIVSNENAIEQSYLTYVSRGDTVSRAFMNDSKFITPLPGTEREVKAIYELFNQKNQPAKYYLNDQANEATVKSINLKPYKYLHFATHGLTDEDRPTNSCLILAQNPTPNPSPNGEGSKTQLPSPSGEGPGVGDNLLTSSEMYGLELDAELVVLSACQTGKGTLKAGEGIIGLTRGLLYAGARNLMVSQWNVNDASTAELMTKFYSKILSGQSNRQALREAKLELLNSKFACPHYWSAFVLVGR
jgi:CHAT domain-containing protein/Tfp pilus assembly protein PilF